MCAVEWKSLEELGNFYGGLSGKSKEDFQDGNAKFVTYMNVYSNMSLDFTIVDMVKVGEDEKQNSIKYGDILFTGSSETPDDCGMSCVVTRHIDEPIYLNSFCFGFRFDDVEKFEPDFLKHYFRCIAMRKAISLTASGVTRFNVSKKRFGKIQIPLLHVSKQQEIVSHLDTFTTLISNLESELDMRRKQYEHYRNQLLDFEGVEGVEWKTIEDIAEIGTGSSNTKDELDNGLYPFFVRSQQVRWQNKYEYDETAIITSGDGVGVGKIFHYIEGKYALHQRAYRIHILDTSVVAKYVYNYMKCKFYDYIMMNAYSSSVTSVRRPMLLNFEVPIPSSKAQQEIVEKLDAFENLIQSLEQEIKLRKQQYEYYREKLLTFEKE